MIRAVFGWISIVACICCSVLAGSVVAAGIYWPAVGAWFVGPDGTRALTLGGVSLFCLCVGVWAINAGDGVEQ